MVPVMAITIVPSFAFSPSPWPAGGIQGPVSIQIEVEADQNGAGQICEYPKQSGGFHKPRDNKY
jgi:hypothetical protein